MPRLLTLGWMLIPATAALAADPVPYPTNPPGSLSQSLPNLVSGSLSTIPTVPPPVMVSQPGWGGLGCPTPVCTTAACPAPSCATRQPLLAPRVHRLPVPLATGCGARGSLLDRLRAWLCGGAGPAITSGCVLAPPVVPLRDWGWKDTTICGTAAACGAPSNCDARGGRLFPMGRAFGRASDSCPTAACPTTFGPRPVHIPLASAYDRSANCARPRPGLLRRLLAFLSPGWFGCEPACDPVSAYGYGGGYETQSGMPLLGQGTPLAVNQPTVGQPVIGQPATASQYPAASAQTGAVGGYHFATSEVKPVSVVPAANVAPVQKTPTYPNAVIPASATQPLTRQR